MGATATRAAGAKRPRRLAPALAARLRRARDAAWGLYAAVLFTTISAAAWPLVVLAPERGVARAVTRMAARIMLAAGRVRTVASGTDSLRRLGVPCVLVANHASEIDAIALTAALPLSFAFVAKDELRRSLLFRWPLERLGTQFVRRRGPPTTPSQTELAVERLRAGDSLLFFPEGTFRRRPGLLRFHRGAFVAAALAGAPIVPIAITGTREMTPRECRLPRRGAIRLEIGPALWPPAAETAAAAGAVRHRARVFIA